MYVSPDADIDDSVDAVVFIFSELEELVISISLT
jgi:hypothetical protein